MTDRAAELPAPPLPAEVDLHDMPKCMFDFDRLMNSELWIKSTGEAFKAAFALWAKAWKQVPAASLPNDPEAILGWVSAALPPGTSIAKIKKVREAALHGFVLCADGRLHHMVLAEDAERAWESKLSYDSEREAGRERLRRWRQAKKDKKALADASSNGKGNIEETLVKHVSPTVRNADETSNTVHNITEHKKEILAQAAESEPASPVATAEAEAGKSEAEVMEEARAIGRAFGDALDAVYGTNAMRTQNVTDEMHVARSWVIDVGMTTAMAAAIFEGEMQAGVDRKKSPIRSMRYLDFRIREAAAKSAAAADVTLIPQGTSADQAVPGAPQRSAEFVQWVSRVRNFKNKGFWPSQWGEPPTDPSNLIPVDVLIEVYGPDWREILRGTDKAGEAA